MKKTIATVILIIIASCNISYAKTASNPTKFISYWFSWGQGGTQYQYPNLRDVPKGVDIAMVAFGLEKPDHSGITIQAWDMDSFKSDVQTLHNNNTQVVLSSGGATAGYPWDDATLTDQQVADQFISFVTTYNLDGLDFDVESGTGSRLPNIIKLIKQRLPNLIISLTLPSTGSAGITPSMATLGKNLYQENALNYVDLMNYDQYWTQPGCTYNDPNVANSCYVQNIQSLAAIIQTWTNDTNKTKQLISNGIMIGYADDAASDPTKITTPTQVAALTSWLKQNGYGAVMTWGLSRDQSSTAGAGQDLAYTTGMTSIAPQRYTNQIIQALQNNNRK
jgi:chitinase